LWHQGTTEGTGTVPHKEDAMSAIIPGYDAPAVAGAKVLPAADEAPSAAEATAFRYVAAALRLSIGWVFLWAFLDKLFGLGHETKSADAWINGGHPTLGFLKFGAKGPLADFYHSIAGAAWADWLFMLGLAGIGVALVAGIAMRLAAAAGALLLLLMWSAVLPPANNPFMDDHIVYALTLVALALAAAGRTLGLGRAWERLPVVRDHGVLK
jgi:thiosulfate dehydrogenase (quinone) large subunit